MTKRFNNVDIECPYFRIYHFVMLLIGELTPAEVDEITTHIDACQPCTTVRDEVALILKGKGQPTRAEELSFLRCLVTSLWTMEVESLFTTVDSRLDEHTSAIKLLVTQLGRTNSSQEVRQ